MRLMLVTICSWATLLLNAVLVSLPVVASSLENNRCEDDGSESNCAASEGDAAHGRALLQRVGLQAKVQSTTVAPKDSANDDDGNDDEDTGVHIHIHMHKDNSVRRRKAGSVSSDKSSASASSSESKGGEASKVDIGDKESSTKQDDNEISDDNDNNNNDGGNNDEINNDGGNDEDGNNNDGDNNNEISDDSNNDGNDDNDDEVEVVTDDGKNDYDGEETITVGAHDSNEGSSHKYHEGKNKHSGHGDVESGDNDDYRNNDNDGEEWSTTTGAYDEEGQYTDDNNNNDNDNNNYDNDNTDDDNNNDNNGNNNNDNDNKEDGNNNNNNDKDNDDDNNDNSDNVGGNDDNNNDDQDDVHIHVHDDSVGGRKGSPHPQPRETTKHHGDDDDSKYSNDDNNKFDQDDIHIHGDDDDNNNNNDDDNNNNHDDNNNNNDDNIHIHVHANAMRNLSKGDTRRYEKNEEQAEKRAVEKTQEAEADANRGNKNKEHAEKKALEEAQEANEADANRGNKNKEHAEKKTLEKANKAKETNNDYDTSANKNDLHARKKLGNVVNNVEAEIDDTLPTHVEAVIDDTLPTIDQEAYIADESVVGIHTSSETLFADNVKKQSKHAGHNTNKFKTLVSESVQQDLQGSKAKNKLKDLVSESVKRHLEQTAAKIEDASESAKAKREESKKKGRSSERTTGEEKETKKPSKAVLGTDSHKGVSKTSDTKEKGEAKETKRPPKVALGAAKTVGSLLSKDSHRGEGYPSAKWPRSVADSGKYVHVESSKDKDEVKTHSNANGAMTSSREKKDFGNGDIAKLVSEMHNAKLRIRRELDAVRGGFDDIYERMENAGNSAVDEAASRVRSTKTIKSEAAPSKKSSESVEHKRSDDEEMLRIVSKIDSSKVNIEKELESFKDGLARLAGKVKEAEQESAAKDEKQDDFLAAHDSKTIEKELESLKDGLDDISGKLKGADESEEARTTKADSNQEDVSHEAKRAEQVGRRIPIIADEAKADHSRVSQQTPDDLFTDNSQAVDSQHTMEKDNSQAIESQHKMEKDSAKDDIKKELDSLKEGLDDMLDKVSGGDVDPADFRAKNIANAGDLKTGSDTDASMIREELKPLTDGLEEISTMIQTISAKVADVADSADELEDVNDFINKDISAKSKETRRQARSISKKFFQAFAKSIGDLNRVKNNVKKVHEDVKVLAKNVKP